MNVNRLFEVFAQLSEASDAMLQLRRFVLDLAVRGELVSPDVETEAISAAPRIVRTEMTRGSELTEARPYLVPPNWNWQSIEEVAVQVSDGEHATPARIVDHQVPLVTAKNVRDGKMVYDQTDWVSHETAVKAWGRCRPIPGDILLVCVGATIGRLCVLREKRDMVLVRSVALIRPSPRMDADFLALALRSPAGQAEMWRRAKVAAQPCLYLNRIRTLCVPVPPLAEQHRIVARVNELMAVCDELEAAQEQRERRRKQLSAASLARLTAARDMPGRVAEKDVTFFLSHASRMVTRAEHVAHMRRAIVDLATSGGLIQCSGAEVELSTIVEHMRYGTAQKCSYQQTEFPVLRIPNVSTGIMDLSDLKYGELTPKEADNLRLDKDDVLVVRSNGSSEIVGTATSVGPKAAGMYYAGYLVRLRPKPQLVESRYAVLAMRSTAYREQIEGPLRTTVGLKNVNSRELGRLGLWLPSLEHQRHIVAKVDELMAVCDELERSLEAAQAGRTRALEAVLHRMLEETSAPLPRLLEVAG